MQPRANPARLRGITIRYAVASLVWVAMAGLAGNEALDQLDRTLHGAAGGSGEKLKCGKLKAAIRRRHRPPPPRLRRDRGATARSLGDLDDGLLRAGVAAWGEFGPVGDVVREG